MPENHLQNTSSPYLLQHKDNPVNWYPWCEEALQRARTENKPILLSIGYSACHWCHVMARESFENTDIAEIMNRDFINIKVDCEERPDLDKIYQAAHSLLTQHTGGWPLTVFLTPDDHMPFFAGTYFPATKKYNMPAFPEILQHVSDAFTQDQHGILQQNQSIRDVFNKIENQESNSSLQLNAQPIDLARNQLIKSFDSQYGGFGTAPKFPHPTNLEFILQLWSHSVARKHEDFDLLHTATYTLECMAKGGIFDQLGGGFYRYSIDNYWQIPHFEKMLHDNGSLLSLYSHAFTIMESPLFEHTILATANWLLSDMQSDNGCFYSSIDADFDDTEGKLYIWTTDQIKEVLDDNDYPLFAEFYGLDKPANIEDKYWHLFQAGDLKTLAEKYDMNIHTLQTQLQTNREQLLKHRTTQPSPGIDKKILTSWNALVIKGLVTASKVFYRDDFVDAAEIAVNFIMKYLWINNRLLATHNDGHSQFNAYLDDYAFLLDAILELLQTRWSDAHLNFATLLADDLLEHFEDRQNGGFYFTRHDHEKLILKQKGFSDGALPSGNGIATQALMKLGMLLSETRYIDAAERALKAAFHSIQQHPASHCSLLQALDSFINNPITTVIIRGDRKTANDWQQQLNKKYHPQCQIFYIPDNKQLPKALATKQTMDRTCAYICHGMQCSAPAYTIEAVTEQLSR